PWGLYINILVMDSAVRIVAIRPVAAGVINQTICCAVTNRLAIENPWHRYNLSERAIGRIDLEKGVILVIVNPRYRLSIILLHSRDSEKLPGLSPGRSQAECKNGQN